MRTLFPVVLAGALLASCGAAAPSPPAPAQTESGAVSSAVSIPASLGTDRLGAMTYVLVDNTVRLALTKARQGFSVPLRDGRYDFPPSLRSDGFTGVRADLQDVAYGDVTGDGVPEAIVPLLVDQGDATFLELAALSASGSTARQIASFPIGKASLKSLAVTEGAVRVNFVHVVPGDPGPRDTELLLRLPARAP